MLNKQYTIYEGNLAELKKIPKTKIPKDIRTELEKTLQEIEDKISINIHNSDCKYSLTYYLDQKNRVESCISYLDKIK